jgi:hypothetical protein
VFLGDAEVLNVALAPRSGIFSGYRKTSRTILIILDSPQTIVEQRVCIEAIADNEHVGLLALDDPRQLAGLSHMPWIASYGATPAQIRAVADVLKGVRAPTGRMPIHLD